MASPASRAKQSAGVLVNLVAGICISDVLLFST